MANKNNVISFNTSSDYTNNKMKSVMSLDVSQSVSQSLKKTNTQNKNNPSDMMNNNFIGGMNPNMMPGKKIRFFVNNT